MSKKKKILIAGVLPPPYHGVTVIFDNLLKSSLNNDFDVIFVDISDHRSIENIAHFDFVNVALAIKSSILFFFKLIYKHPDLVYLVHSETYWGFVRDLFFLIPSILLKKKIILHSHGAHFREFYLKECSRWLKFIIRWIFKNISAVIVLCKKLKFNYNWIVSEDKIYVVGNGIQDLKNIGKIDRLQDNKFRILFLSNLKIEKGYYDVLNAIKYILPTTKNVQFNFVGEWNSENDKLKAIELMENENLNEYVEFKGKLIGEEKEKILLQSDIFVFPTYYPIESWGLVINEAMAASLPVISTNRGCISEIVVDGETGYIIPEKNPKVLAEKINLLLKNKDLRIKMGKAGRERFLKYYTFDKFIDNLENTFNIIYGKEHEK